MNKNAQILIGVGVLSLGGFLYWKSTQSGTLNATGAVSKTKEAGTYHDTLCYNAKGQVIPCKKNATGTKAVPKNFFKTEGSVDGINNFKNAAGIFTGTPVKKVFESADGFKAASSEKVFASANGGFFHKKPDGFTKTKKAKIFTNASGSFNATPQEQVFANMIPTMSTQNSGTSFM